MSSQVSSSPTNSMMGPDLEACPAWVPRSRDEEKGVGLLPCGHDPAIHMESLGRGRVPKLAEGIEGEGIKVDSSQTLAY